MCTRSIFIGISLNWILVHIFLLSWRVDQIFCRMRYPFSDPFSSLVYHICLKIVSSTWLCRLIKLLVVSLQCWQFYILHLTDWLIPLWSWLISLQYVYGNSMMSCCNIILVQIDLIVCRYCLCLIHIKLVIKFMVSSEITWSCISFLFVQNNSFLVSFYSLPCWLLQLGSLINICIVWI